MLSNSAAPRALTPVEPARGRRACVAVLALLALTLGACAGGDGGSPTGPKTCQQDPTQSFCQDTTTKPTATLASASQAKGRYFGTAIDALFTASPQNPTYMSTLGKEFGMITPGNVLKWEPLRRNGRDAAYRFTWPDSMLAYATSHGMKMRGHTLVWHNQLPQWLTGTASAPISWPADTLRAILLDHIATVVGHYKGKLYAWDVVNEALADGSGALRSTIWSNTLGPSYIDTAFAAARRADPNALLFYNDYSLEYPGAKQDSAFALVSRLKAAGLIDGIGFQGHIQINADGSGNPGKQSLIATFNRFAALGLKIEITELDVRVQTTSGNPTSAALTAQNQTYGDIVSACLAVTACDAIVVWGITDAESWIPSTFPGWGQALLFDNAYGKKATYNAVMSALTGS